MNRYLFCLLVFICPFAGAAQGFSMASDFTVLRNLSPKQKFWAFGQTVQLGWDLNLKDGGYARLNYFSTGKFHNSFQAPERSLGTIPSLIDYTVTGSWTFRQISLGWKHYFVGSNTQDNGWSLFGEAGFGLLFTQVSNTFSTAVDTLKYAVPAFPVSGTGEFRRLSLDLGLGLEFPLNSSFYLYSDLRTWIPSSSDPSPFFHDTRNIPLPVSISAGIRILFGE